LVSSKGAKIWKTPYYRVQKDISGVEVMENDLSILTLEKFQPLCRSKGNFHPGVPGKCLTSPFNLHSDVPGKYLTTPCTLRKTRIVHVQYKKKLG